MVLNIKLSKAFPERAIQYAVGKNLLDKPIRQNLFDDKDSIKEMKETASKFGKWSTRGERKTFSMIISPNPKDNPTQEQVIEVSKAILDRFFPTIQGFLVLHRDKGRDAQKTNPVLHSHFYGSIVDPISGKNIHLSNKDMKAIREWADSYAYKHFGWSTFERGKHCRNRYRKLMLKEMVRSGHSSWMRELMVKVEEAYNGALSFSDFERRLRNQGISLENTEGSGQLRFCVDVDRKNINVNATTISKYLDWKALSSKFLELDKEVNIGSKECDQRSTAEIQVGAGTNKRGGGDSRTGKNFGGTEPGRSIQEIKYSCVFCTRDKDICRNCADFKKERGEYSHGIRTL